MQRPRLASAAELAKFHAEDYLEFLARVTPDNQAELATQLAHFNMGEDCPVFEGLFDFCRLYAGASIEGAVKLNHGLCDIAINWAGGLHHAKKSEASGVEHHGPCMQDTDPGRACRTVLLEDRVRLGEAISLSYAAEALLSSLLCLVKQGTQCHSHQQGPHDARHKECTRQLVR